MRAFFITAAVILCHSSISLATPPVSCGSDDNILFHMVTDASYITGDATLTGDALGFWLGDNGQTLVELRCRRQGGSSMPSWWTCETALISGTVTAVYTRLSGSSDYVVKLTSTLNGQLSQRVIACP